MPSGPHSSPAASSSRGGAARAAPRPVSGTSAIVRRVTEPTRARAAPADERPAGRRAVPARRGHRHAAGWRPSTGRSTPGSTGPSRSSSCVARSSPTRTSRCASDARRWRRPSCATRTSSPASRPAPTTASRTSSWSSSRARTSPRGSGGSGGLRPPRRHGSGSTSPGRSAWRTSAGIVHRDVKPGNILLARDGRAMVTDFGIARLAADAEGAVPGTTLGSVHYFSPEQAKGETTTAASDVYSLGLVLYEALTGRRAWTGDTTAPLAAARVGAAAPSPRAVRPEVPAALDAIVVRALDPDPGAAVSRTGPRWPPRSSRSSRTRIRRARPWRRSRDARRRRRGRGGWHAGRERRGRRWRPPRGRAIRRRPSAAAPRPAPAPATSPAAPARSPGIAGHRRAAGRAGRGRRGGRRRLLIARRCPEPGDAGVVAAASAIAPPDANAEPDAPADARPARPTPTPDSDQGADRRSRPDQAAAAARRGPVRAVLRLRVRPRQGTYSRRGSRRRSASSSATAGRPRSTKPTSSRLGRDAGALTFASGRSAPSTRTAMPSRRADARPARSSRRSSAPMAWPPASPQDQTHRQAQGDRRGPGPDRRRTAIALFGTAHQTYYLEADAHDPGHRHRRQGRPRS